MNTKLCTEITITYLNGGNHLILKCYIFKVEFIKMLRMIYMPTFKNLNGDFVRRDISQNLKFEAFYRDA